MQPLLELQVCLCVCVGALDWFVCLYRAVDGGRGACQQQQVHPLLELQACMCALWAAVWVWLGAWLRKRVRSVSLVYKARMSLFRAINCTTPHST